MGLIRQKSFAKKVAQRHKAETSQIVQSFRRFHCESMRQFKKTLKAYGGLSTVHGVPYILDEGQHPLEKMLWIFLVGIGCWVVAYLSLKIYDDWQANPVITTVSTTGYSIKNIPYPSITICAQGSIREISGDVNYSTLFSHALRKNLQFLQPPQEIFSLPHILFQTFLP